MTSFAQLSKTELFLYVGSFLCVSISISLALLSNEHAHWFMLPITLCALLLLPDVAKWLTGKYDLFDPLGIIGVLGLPFFFLNPILHVYYDTWMFIAHPPTDWRPWLGYMGILNAVGLVIYRYITSHAHFRYIRPKTYWKINHSKSIGIFIFALAVTLSAQLYVFARFGGIMGFIYAYDAGVDAFAGMGWIFMISESFPILLMMLYAIMSVRYQQLRSWRVIVFALSAYLLVIILFGGLRGSRSAVAWPMFWAIGMVHFWVRPINKRISSVGLVFLFGFMYIYGPYKSYGIRSFEIMKKPELLRVLSDKSGRTKMRTLLGDMGRSDVQAFVLYVLSGDSSKYQYKFGSTYLSGLTLLLPRPIRPNIHGKAEAGFELFTGMPSMGDRSFRVYGLAGEAMLNFGPAGVPFAFAIFAWLVSICRSFLRRLKTDDTRVLLYPLVVSVLIMLLTGDFGMILFFIIKVGFIPCLILWFYSRINSLNLGVA